MYQWIVVWTVGVSAGILAAYLRFHFVEKPQIAAEDNGTMPENLPGIRPHLVWGATAGALASLMTTGAHPALQVAITAAVFTASKEALGFSLVTVRTAVVADLTQMRGPLSIIDGNRNADREGGTHEDNQRGFGA